MVDMGGQDNFQPDLTSVGNSAGLFEQPLGSRISNYNARARGPRLSSDRTRTTLGGTTINVNPQREFTDQDLAHGVDWAEINYNPYGKANDADSFTNPNRRRLSDSWAQVTGMGVIELIDEDVVGGDESTGAGMLQYRNYPGEGYSSFGKKEDKRWTWNGNSWVPES